MRKLSQNLKGVGEEVCGEENRGKSDPKLTLEFRLWNREGVQKAEGFQEMALERVWHFGGGYGMATYF